MAKIARQPGSRFPVDKGRRLCNSLPRERPGPGAPPGTDLPLLKEHIYLTLKTTAIAIVEELRSRGGWDRG